MHEAVTHRTLPVNGIDIHVAEAGEGPLVLLLHGFPELWYSWRHQLPALAAAGYHAVAPDVRGYGRTSVPTSVRAYAMRELVTDAVGVLDALGEPTAALVGHDWGAAIAWASLRSAPERFSLLAALSTPPFQARPPMPPVERMRLAAGDRFNWLLHCQPPGVAERELEADPRRSLRLFMHALSGDAPDGFALHLLTGLPSSARFLDSIPEPDRPSTWLTEADLDYYAGEFARTGFGGAVNRYRNIDFDWHDLPELGTGTVEQPVLFLAGAQETAIRYADWDFAEKHVPNLERPPLLRNGGHWIQQEQPDAVNRALVEFLRGHIR